jgi:phosphoribosylaminoimidazole carboxylase
MEVAALVERLLAGEASTPALHAHAPLVGVIMGSDSDLPTMAVAGTLLRDFGVPFEVTIVSAHRTPRRLYEYASSARARGLRVLIAAAGGAAHLPGMAAALTPLPVIGVPVPLKQLDGVDSLYSIVQMPRGVPVATVAIGNATNAALLAVRMLGASMPHLLDAMERYQRDMEAGVLDKVEDMARRGWEAFLGGKSSS